MVDYGVKVGDQKSNTLTVPDRTIAYGLRGKDTLSTSVGGTSVLVGGSGSDQYIVANNSTAIISDIGNSAKDVIISTGIGFNTNTTLTLEIDNRHLVASDTVSGQTVLLLDWQNAANKIESVQFGNGTFTYDFLASNLRNTVGHLGNYTLEEADAQLLNGELAANGLTRAEINPLINEIKTTNTLLSGASSSSLFSLAGDLLNLLPVTD